MQIIEVRYLMRYLIPAQERKEKKGQLRSIGRKTDANVNTKHKLHHLLCPRRAVFTKTSPQLWLPEELPRKTQPSPSPSASSLSLLSTFHLRSPTPLLNVHRKDLNPPQMRILPILMILHNRHLQHPAKQRIPVRAPAHTLQRHPLPPLGRHEVHGREPQHVVLARSRAEDYPRGRVRLVLVVVDVEADLADGDLFDEVDC